MTENYNEYRFYRQLEEASNGDTEALAADVERAVTNLFREESVTVEEYNSGLSPDGLALAAMFIFADSPEGHEYWVARGGLSR